MPENVMLGSPETSVSEAQNYKPQQTLHKKEHHYKSIQITQCNLTNKIRCICRFDVGSVDSDVSRLNHSSKTTRTNHLDWSYIPWSLDQRVMNVKYRDGIYMQTCNRSATAFLYLFMYYMNPNDT